MLLNALIMHQLCKQLNRTCSTNNLVINIVTVAVSSDEYEILYYLRQISLHTILRMYALLSISFTLFSMH